MKKSLLFVVLVLAAAALVSMACQGGSKTVEVTVTATEFKFNPDTVTVKVGDHVKLTLDNKGTLQHTYVQPDLNIKATADAGKTAIVEFTPTQAGTFNVECDVPGHKDAGMTGKIIVQP